MAGGVVPSRQKYPPVNEAHAKSSVSLRKSGRRFFMALVGSQMHTNV